MPAAGISQVVYFEFMFAITGTKLNTSQVQMCTATVINNDSDSKTNKHTWSNPVHFVKIRAILKESAKTKGNIK